MKKLNGFIMLFICAAMIFGMASCNSNAKDEPVYYKVTFDSANGSALESQKIEKGKTVSKPTDPTKSGYDFGGWYKDSEAFDFTTPITSNITLKAKWDTFEGFERVAGSTIDGTESWTPESNVFISGRSLVIPDLVVCNHEVTRGEFKEVMGTDPSTAPAYDKDGNELTGNNVLNNPVNYVNWYDALVYCNKLSVKEGFDCVYEVRGITDWENFEYSSIPTSKDSTWDAAICNFEAKGYRLPTEAEWEWLARGGENYTYAGNDDIEQVSWCLANTNKTGTREVKTKDANKYELYDMSGNVWEWCWDWSASINSSTGMTGAPSSNWRVLRGGSWRVIDSQCAVSYRSNGGPSFRFDFSGFRVVRNDY